jgi:hypothetical protein
MTNKKITISIIIAALIPLITCCCVIPFLGSINSFLYQQLVMEPIYEKELGIGTSNQELLVFFESELKGHSHSEVLETLQQWGEIGVLGCTDDFPNYGECIILLSKFLGTKKSYRLVLFYNDGFVEKVFFDQS